MKMTKAKMIELMKRRARAFKKLTPSAKRVAIAKDVIAQLNTKRLTATRGVYIEMGAKKVRSSGQQVCELTAGVSCQVCALGAMFVAGVERADDLSVADLGFRRNELFSGDNGDGAYSYLKRFFKYDQLRAIEKHFEGWGEVSCGEADVRMLQIMENIVKNRGRFSL